MNDQTTAKSARAAQRLPSTGDTVDDVWRLMIRTNSKMLNMLTKSRPELAPGQRISFSRIRVISFIAQSGGVVKVKDLAKELGITSGGVSQIVDNLVKSNLVVRTVSPTDRRAVCLSISDTAKARQQVVDEFFHEVMERALSKVSETHRKELVKALRMILTELESE